MSGIYIKNMEIPTSCVDCTLEQEGGWCGANLKIKDVHRGHKVSDRHKDCPLVPVPDHGLIDREKILDAVRLELAQAEATEDMDDYNDWIRVFDYVRKFPTIIPTDKDGAE